jgi:hypothetical protein
MHDQAHLTSGVGDRLADVSGFEPGQVFSALVQGPGEPAEQVRSLTRGDHPPGGKRRLGPGDGLFDVLDPCLRHLGEGLLGRRFQDPQSLCGARGHRQSSSSDAACVAARIRC